MARLLLIIALLFGLSAPSAAEIVPGDDNLYRITTLRAAPGQWKELRTLIEGQGEAGSVSDTGRIIPYRMRHSNGDQWDFMLIQPMLSYASYFSPARRDLERPFRDAVDELADFSEDWFVAGPSHAELAAQFDGAGLYHIEIFRARAGQKAALLDQRLRENALLGDMGLVKNTVWVGLYGADWDAMTIGFHESWATYGRDNIAGSDEDWERLSRKHGFDGPGDLAPQLRDTLTSHNDTYAVRMK